MKKRKFRLRVWFEKNPIQDVEADLPELKDIIKGLEDKFG